MNISINQFWPALTCLLLPILLASCATNESISNKANDETNKAIYIIKGRQSPVVVLQAGLGDGKEVWSEITPNLSNDYTTFAFDRPGRADNPPTNAPRDACTIASEQRALLESLNLKPPYVLVGHSMGGLYQFAFAKLYPNDVSGIVLVDPTPPNHWERMQKEASDAARIMRIAKFILFSDTDKREFDEMAQCLERLDFNHPLNVPTKILVAGKFTGLGEEGDFENMMKHSRLQWLKLTTAPKLDVVKESGHYIQKESSEDVISAIKQVVFATNQKTKFSNLEKPW